MENADKNENSIIKIVKGVGISFLITLFTIFIFSIILTYTNISENVIPVTIIVLTFISILIGSIITTKNISKNGLINGACIGGIYVVLLYLISSVTNTGFSLNIYSIYYSNVAALFSNIYLKLGYKNISIN